VRAKVLLALVALALACEPTPTPAPERPVERPERPHNWTPPPPDNPPERVEPDEPPTIPGQLLEKLPTARAGSFSLPADAARLQLHAAVTLGRSFALVGELQIDREGSEPAEPRRWFGVAASGARPVAGKLLSSGSISATIGDGQGGALLVGHVATSDAARAWFGALDARGRLVHDQVFEGDHTTAFVDVLAGQEPDEHALALGNVGGQGWLVSLDSRGRVRWEKSAGGSGPVEINGGVRLHDSADVIAIGRGIDDGGAWWASIAATDMLTASKQGTLQVLADPERTIAAIVDLGDNGLMALGLAKHQPAHPHHQVFAAGFDRTGAPTWIRVLDHFRAIEINGGTMNPKQPGVAHFVLRIPVAGGEDRSALAWLDIMPGVDGIMIPRQLAGTEGWSSAGFIDTGADPEIVTYTRTASGIDWRTLAMHHKYRGP
jgi:hypothetical protein